MSEDQEEYKPSWKDELVFILERNQIPWKKVIIEDKDGKPLQTIIAKRTKFLYYGRDKYVTSDE